MVRQQKQRKAKRTVSQIARLFNLLGNEIRLRILLLVLSDEHLSVQTIAREMNLSQPAVSHHLGLLRLGGVLDCRRQGKRIFYRCLSEDVRDLVGQLL
jgi:ArsR family transcriptional regulator